MVRKAALFPTPSSHQPPQPSAVTTSTPSPIATLPPCRPSPPTAKAPLSASACAWMAGALAALLSRAEGAELPEDELLDLLRAAGLITYPSPLLGQLHEELRDVVAADIMPRLDAVDLAMLGRTGWAGRAAVVSSGLLRAGSEQGVPLTLEHFCGSVERLDWAKANGCPWGTQVCSWAAGGGHLEVLQWARVTYNRPWNEWTCAAAAEGGHLHVLHWARAHGCPWCPLTCLRAALGGHLGVLRWACEHGCPWRGPALVAAAARSGSVETIQYVDAMVEAAAATAAEAATAAAAAAVALAALTAADAAATAAEVVAAAAAAAAAADEVVAFVAAAEEAAATEATALASAEAAVVAATAASEAATTASVAAHAGLAAARNSVATAIARAEFATAKAWVIVMIPVVVAAAVAEMSWPTYFPANFGYFVILVFVILPVLSLFLFRSVFRTLLLSLARSWLLARRLG